MDFLKKYKNPILGPFLTMFGHFCRKGFFLKIWALSCTSLYEPLTPYKVSEKPNKPIPRKLQERRTQRRTDPNSYDPYGNDWGSQKRSCICQVYL